MWIKIEYSLPAKPEVFLLAQELLISKQEVIGYLVELWLWLDQISEDGKIKGNREMVDNITMVQFANALIKVGWLHVYEDTLEFVNFDRHNGTSAKKRASNARKVADFRKRKQGEEIKKPKPVTQELLEKNREDKEKKMKYHHYQKIADLWNDNNSPKVSRLTTKRKTAIRSLLKEFTEEDCKVVFSKIPNIPFMQGKNDMGWVATFDYILKPEKFVRVLEGLWDNTNQEKKENKFNEWTQ